MAGLTYLIRRTTLCLWCMDAARPYFSLYPLVFGTILILDGCLAWFLCFCTQARLGRLINKSDELGSLCPPYKQTRQARLATATFTYKIRRARLAPVALKPTSHACFGRVKSDELGDSQNFRHAANVAYSPICHWESGDRMAPLIRHSPSIH
eukprot:2812733-Pleurochrysis_carterae.AAC.1